MNQYIDIVFEEVEDGEGGPANQVFVEVEDPAGRSIRLGEWVNRADGFSVLRIPDPRRTDEPVQKTDEKQHLRDLHSGLDELLASYVMSTKGPVLDRTLAEFLDWSYQRILL